MHPAGPPPPQNRSCPSPSLTCPSPSPSLVQQQQQQQHVIYGPITTLQHCATNLHPHCVYTGVPRNPGLPGAPGPLTNQVPIRQSKGTKWQPKSKPPRGHQQSHHHQHQHQHQPSHLPQYCQPLPQQHVQPPLSYIPKPLVLFDQCTANTMQSTAAAAAPQLPGGSFLVASSGFPSVPYASGDAFTSTSGLTLIPQPYFKPPDVAQGFCLLPERPQHHHHPHQHHSQQSFGGQNPGYYNISTGNGCGVQGVSSKPGFPVTNVNGSYSGLAAFAGGQINAGQAAAPSQICQQNPPSVSHGGPLGDQKLTTSVGAADARVMTYSRNLTVHTGPKQQRPSQSTGQDDVEWYGQTARETLDNTFEVPDSGRSQPSAQGNRIGCSTTETSKNQEERYSDESAASFDFTIEAEKMVSALCNTASSNDIGKDETRGRNENSPSFSGAAGDNVTNKTNIWFADFCTEYGVNLGENCRNTGTQTRENRDDSRTYPESMRKTIYWGCNEAESILNSGNYRCTSRAEWLASVASATRTAVTKSSTCFPIYSGDRTFVEDLINALLRISNGWLVLDNYLNKQHHPSLGEKFDGDLTRGFRSWEVATNDLLRELVRTFVKIEENNALTGSSSLEAVGRQENRSNNSFPGDVSLYTNCDLLDSSQCHRENVRRVSSDGRNDRDSTYTLQYASHPTSHPNFRSFEAQHTAQKETKLRSKWTITENLSSTMDSAKSVPETSLVPSEPGFPGAAKYRVKSGSANPSGKISSSTRHSLNAEFFHLRNKVMETMGNSSDSDRQRWGLTDHRNPMEIKGYDIVFGSSGIPHSASASSEPLYKLRAAGTGYENSYIQRRLPVIDSTVSVNHQAPSHPHANKCANSTSVFLVTGAETALDSTYAAGKISASHLEPDYTGRSERTEHNCGVGPAIVTADPVYVGNSSPSERELVPRSKMTLLSQIEGNTLTSSGDTREMTASLSAWFASMRNPVGRRGILCTTEGSGRKNENALMPTTTTTTRTSSHPQETSRSAMDLNRQLHMDGNRQLQILQNMQTIQSQPWNACNLLNGKRAASSKSQHVDEYDSSEDVRIYMKPGSYNVPKKRHHRNKNNRRVDNPVSSRGNGNTPRPHIGRAGSAVAYNSTGGKNHQMSASVSSLTISSSVQVTSSTSGTSAAVKVSFPPSSLVPHPACLSLESSPRIGSRVISDTRKAHPTRIGSGLSHNSSGGKNHQMSTAVSSLVISSSVQVSSTTTASPVVPSPGILSLDDSPRMARRVRSIASDETRQDVAWKAACASAEILLEALNVKESFEAGKRDTGSDRLESDTHESRVQRHEAVDRLDRPAEVDDRPSERDFRGASSYEASEDDSDSTCKSSAHSQIRPKPREFRHPRTNVKTDSWLIRTLNNASIVSKINDDDESGAESTIDDYPPDDSGREDRRERQTVVTSTPEPMKNPGNEDSSGSTVVAKNLDDSFQEKTDCDSPRGCGSRETSSSSSRQALSASSPMEIKGSVDTSGELAGRATYSETVRRSTLKSCQSTKKDSGRSRQTRAASFVASALASSVRPGKKDQRKDDKTFQTIGKLEKVAGKRMTRDLDEKDSVESNANRKMVRDAASGDDSGRASVPTKTRKKEDIGLEWPEMKSKTNDRGWSVWYSSRRRQTLTPLALNKLATIHQTVWQMDGAHVLKYPAAGSSAVGALSETIEDYCKIVKSPMFLETIGYKLKNRIYHKVEHVIRDFRRIIKNSKLYHKNDTDRVAKIETLSRKLEDLFDEHLSAWDSESVPDSPGDENSCTAQASRRKSPRNRHLKSAANRFPATKKIPATSSRNEN